MTQDLKDWAEDHGYTIPCRGCGQIGDTSWCGCAAGAPEDEEPDERAGIESLNEEIDQLSATARDLETLPAAVQELLDLAWWFTEDYLRSGLGSCGHNPRSKDTNQLWDAATKTYSPCECCKRYEELTAKALRIKQSL